MKKLLILFSIGFLLNQNPLIGQFSDSDVILSINGLSDTYTKKFEDNKKVFVDALNNSDLPSSIKPLMLEINFIEGVGHINLYVNFSVDEIYSENSQYKQHSDQFRIFGTGISFLFQHQLMLCLSEYKFTVADDVYSLDNRIVDFGSVITLVKPNGDALRISAYNLVDNRYTSGSLFPYYFDSIINMEIEGKRYSTECGNLKTLNEKKMFFVNELDGLDGKKTGAYYFCKFFNILVE